MGEQLEVPLETGVVDGLLVFLLVVGLTEQDVVADCIVDDPRLLGDETDGSIDCHFGLGHVLLVLHFSEEGVHEGGLARSDVSDDCHHFSSLDGEVHVLESEIDSRVGVSIGFLVPVEIAILDIDGVGPV